jgi:hypothetical protein
MQIHAFEVDGWDAKQEGDRKMGSNIFCRDIISFVPLSFYEISKKHSE